jgi:hypothetical protein
MRRMKRCALLLTILGLSQGCALIQKPAPIARANLCRDWRHETISKDDQISEKTAAQIEAANKSRPAWGCKYGG